MNFYRNNWYKLTLVAFIFLWFFMGSWGMDRLTVIQKILMYSFMALLIHQFEEYVLPGGGPIVINKANFNEKINFRSFPGNMQSSMIVNNLAYIFLLLL